MANKPKPTVHYREVVKGQYVSAEYARRHPEKTVRETDKPCPKPSKGGKKG